MVDVLVAVWVVLGGDRLAAQLVRPRLSQLANTAGPINGNAAAAQPLIAHETRRNMGWLVQTAALSCFPAPAPRCRAVKAAIIPGKTKLVMLESPTNPRMQICDIRAICTVSGGTQFMRARTAVQLCIPTAIVPGIGYESVQTRPSCCWFQLHLARA
jgi:hypothetical protein